jgi:hypothetical protein
MDIAAANPTRSYLDKYLIVGQIGNRHVTVFKVTWLSKD